MVKLDYKNRKKNIFKDLATLIMPFLLILSEITGSPTPFYIAVAISVLMIMNPFVIFPAYFIASLSSTYFSPVVGLGAGRVFSVVLILSLLMRKESYQQVSGYKDTAVLCLLIIVYNFFSSVFSLSGTFFTFFVMLQNLIIMIFLQRQRNVDLDWLSTMLYWSSVIVLIGLLFEAMRSGVTIETNDRYTVESTNENNYAMMCAQLGTVIMGFVFLKNSIFYRYCSIVLFLTSLVIIFLSGSRASLVGTLGSFVLVSIITAKGNVVRTLFISLLLAVPILMFYNYAANSDVYLLQRFSLNSIADSGGSGRLPIIKVVVTEIIPNHLLFGVGIGGLNSIAAGLPKPCHNIILDPLSQIGLFGCLLYWLTIIPIISRSLKVLRNNKIIILPVALFFTGLFNGIGETIFYEKFFWNAITLCLLYGNIILKQRQTHGEI